MALVIICLVSFPVTPDFIAKKYQPKETLIPSNTKVINESRCVKDHLSMTVPNACIAAPPAYRAPG